MEKHNVPICDDIERDETLLILTKDFNTLIEDGDSLKEDEIGQETARTTWETAAKPWKTTT